ncbi:hypothetical protein BH11BAC7_BH11BAC7_34320 [soil metagenome]
MKNKFLLLVAVLVISTTSFAANLPNSTNTSVITIDTARSNDMIAKVKEYMSDQGLMIIYVEQEAGTSNYLVNDIFGRWFRVYTCETVVIGWDQVDL